MKRTKPKARNFTVTREMVEAFRTGEVEHLDRLCGIRPWMPGIFDVDTPEPPALEKGVWRDFWPEVRAMREAIEKAARA